MKTETVTQALTLLCLPVKIAHEPQALPTHPSFMAWLQLSSRSSSLGLCPQDGPRLGLIWGLVTRRPMPTPRAGCRYRMGNLPKNGIMEGTAEPQLFLQAPG